MSDLLTDMIEELCPFEADTVEDMTPQLFKLEVVGQSVGYDHSADPVGPEQLQRTVDEKLEHGGTIGVGLVLVD